MKRIFVCSPFGGSVSNLNKAKKLCKEVAKQGHAPFAPHVFCSEFLDDNKPSDRELGLAIGIAFLKVCDELWYYEGREGITEGMRAELAVAKALGIPCKRFEVN